jgi:hypothetical protein
MLFMKNERSHSAATRRTVCATHWRGAMKIQVMSLLGCAAPALAGTLCNGAKCNRLFCYV